MIDVAQTRIRADRRSPDDRSGLAAAEAVADTNACSRRTHGEAEVGSLAGRAEQVLLAMLVVLGLLSVPSAPRPI